jgi:hypothetical protein
MANKEPPDINDNNILLNLNEKPEYKCFSIYEYDEINIKMIDELMKISKNVYNSTIYCL